MSDKPTWRKVPMVRGTGQLWQNGRRQQNFRHRLGSSGPLRTFTAGSVSEAREHVVRMGWTRRADPGANPTLGALCDAYLEWRAGDADARPGSIKATRTRFVAWRKTCPALWGSQLSSLAPHDLEDAYRTLRQHYAPRTVLQMHVALSGAFTWAERRWHIDHLPRRAQTPRIGDADRRQPLTPEEVAKLLAAARERGGPLHLLVELLAGTGMRRGEVLGLRWVDVDLDAGTIKVERQRTEFGVDRPLKTRRSRRVVSSTADCMDALRECVGPAGELVVGMHQTMAGDAWLGLVRGLGQSWTMHQLRHTVATHLLASGWSLAEVAAQLGDSVATVARVYAHSTQRQLSIARSLPW